jgi:RNA polymerase sigma-70 factor (ECF subfamily)
MTGATAVRRQPLESWMSAHEGELRAHLTRFVDPDEAEDVLQEVWITAHRRPPGEGPSANVRAWLYRVATNVALDRLGTARRRRRLLDEGAARLEPDEPPHPGEDVRSDAVRARVRTAIARLPRKQREAVWFRWADGLEYQGVAQKMGCSIESARANVYQGMKRLRRDLSDLLEEIER